MNFSVYFLHRERGYLVESVEVRSQLFETLPLGRCDSLEK